MFPGIRMKTSQELFKLVTQNEVNFTPSLQTCPSDSVEENL